MEINTVQFRANCFKILDHVQNSHAEIIITKRGKPIAKLTPMPQVPNKDPLLGAMQGLGRDIADLTEPVVAPEDWEGLK
jgi:prevent-host-death family protein